MKTIFMLLSISILVSCRSTHHSREYKYRENFDPDGKYRIALVDFKLYIREIYRDSSNKERIHSAKFLNQSEPLNVEQYSLVPHSNHQNPVGKKLIEVEYLLYSEKQGKVIYITTVPDVNQKYYANDRKKHPHADSLNVYDFNTFHLGSVGKDLQSKTQYIILQGLKKPFTYRWEFNIENNEFSILRILEFYDSIYHDERSVVNSIKWGAKFRPVGNYTVFFRSPGLGPLELKDSNIYFLHPRKKFCVYFKFNLPAAKNVRVRKNRSDPPDSFSTLLFRKSKQVPVDPSIIWELIP